MWAISLSPAQGQVAALALGYSFYPTRIVQWWLIKTSCVFQKTAITELLSLAFLGDAGLGISAWT